MANRGLIANSKAFFQRKFRRKWENEIEFLDGYLRNITGLIHVGANLGQEREFYRLFGVDVIWVESIQEIYDELLQNIVEFKRQKAYLALLTDKEGEEYEFKIANNNGASSSILPMDKHAELWPEIQYIETRKLKSTTLELLMRREHISPKHYQGLTMDVEGAELMVLKGAGSMLRKFQYVKAEVADFTPRTGSPVTGELSSFLEDAGFEELIRRPFAEHPTGGTYWDIVWVKRPRVSILHRPNIQRPVIARDISGWDKV